MHHIELLLQPSTTIAKIHLGHGESFTSQWGAMLAASRGIAVETNTRTRGSGGFLKSIKRVLAGESLFVNHFTAIEAGWVMLGPALPGDLCMHELRGGTLIVQGAGWLASSEEIDVDASWQGFGKALFSGESMFWLRLSGQGTVLLSSFGAIETVEIDGEYVVDTGNIVAFEDTLTFDIAKAQDSLVGSYLSGEGLVSRFRGKGRLWCQTHQPETLGMAVGFDDDASIRFFAFVGSHPQQISREPSQASPPPPPLTHLTPSHATRFKKHITSVRKYAACS